MERLIIISNRLPVSIDINENEVNIKPSVGGLATGMKSFYKSYESLWIGWAGIDKNELSEKQFGLCFIILPKMRFSISKIGKLTSV